MGLIELAPQNARDGVLAGVPASACAPVARFGGLELVRDVVDVSVQLTQQCQRLSASRVIDHGRILSSFLNARIVVGALDSEARVTRRAVTARSACRRRIAMPRFRSVAPVLAMATHQFP